MLRMLDVRRVLVKVRSSVRSDWVLYLAVCVYIIVLSTITILKNRALLTSGFDLGIFNQAFSTTLFNQKFFYTTGDLSFNPGGSFFGTHFSPILFLLLPFYAICPGVENLLVMQTVILAIGAFPVYWMSRDRLGKKVGLIVSTVYLVYPPLVLLNLNDFHLEPFISTFFLFGVYYFEREEWIKSFAFIILAMLTLEFAPIIGVFMALYGLRLYQKKRFRDKRAVRKCFLIALLSLLVFFLAYMAKASFNPSTSPLPSPFHYILSNPAEMLSVIFVDWRDKIFYLITFLAPLAFLPLFAPEPLIMALPWIGLSYISTYTPYYSVYYQYTGFVIPFVFVALPKAIERLRLQDARRISAIILLPTIFFLLFVPVGFGSPWNYKLPIPDERTEWIEKFLPLIPPNATILTQNDIFPHLSNRMNVYMYLPKDSNVTVDYILVDVSSVMYDWEQSSYFGDRIAPSQLTFEGLTHGTYGILASAGSLLLLKKDYHMTPALFVPLHSKYNYQNLSLKYGSPVPDPTSTSSVVLYHGEEHQIGDFWYGPYITLPPGKYRVTYVTKVNGPDEIIKNENKTLFTVDVTYYDENGIQQPIETAMVKGSSALSAGQWFNSMLFFNTTTLRPPIKRVEFRGHVPDNQSISVYLDYLIVEQLYAAFNYKYRTLALGQGNVSNGVMTHVNGTGTFWHGPYSSLPKGNYTAKFWLKLDQPFHGSLLDIDVSIDSGKKVLTSLTVHSSNFEKIGKWQSFDVKFTLQDELNIVEFRGVNVRDKAPISLLAVEVRPDTSLFQQLIYKTTFNYEDLKLVQGNVSNGVMTHVRGTGTFWCGPYACLPKGSYTAEVWLKLDEPYSGSLLDIDVSINYGQPLASLTVHSSNFEEIGKWQSFDVKFTLQDELNIVEFRGVNVRDKAPISLLSVEVYSDVGPSEQIMYETTFNYEDLKLVQGNVSSGVMTHAKGNGTFWHGPYISLLKGNYTAKFWLKLDEPYSGSLLDIDVSINYGQPLASLTVHSSNFEEIGKWQSFDVKFTLQDDWDIVEFRGMNVRGAAPVSLLSVEVCPDTVPSQQLIYKTEFNCKDLRLVQGTVRNDVMTHVRGTGTFWCGPYACLPKGSYTATFWLRLDQPYTGSLLDIDVSINSGERRLASLAVHSSDFEEIGKWQSFDVKFTLQDELNTVEFRGVNVRGMAPVSLLSVEVYPITVPSQQIIYKTAFNYEDLKLVQGNVSKGVMTHVKGTGTFWYGPYASLPKGSYTAKFLLKLDNESYHGSLLDIDVSINSGERRLASLAVHSSDFEEIDKWQSFDVKFTLQDGRNIVEFRGMNVRDMAPTSLLSVEVYPDIVPSKQLVYKTAFNYKGLKLVQGTVSNGIMTHVKGTGTFWCGPYTSLPKGNYTATFWLKLDQPYPGSLLDIDVSINSGKPLASLMVSDSDFKRIDTWQNFEVKFTIQEDWANGVEFRGMNVRGVAPVSLLSVEVYSDISPPQQLIYKAAFNYEDLTLVQGTVSSGVMTHTRENGTGTFWYGPRNCSLPKGNYTAKFWLKLDEPYAGSLLEIDVSTNSGERRLTSLLVSDSNFDGINTWRSLEVKFTIQEEWGNAVEFRGINVRSAAPVSCLLVEVSRY